MKRQIYEARKQYEKSILKANNNKRGISKRTPDESEDEEESSRNMQDSKS